MLRLLRDPVANAASFGLLRAKAESCVDPAQMENRGRAPQIQPSPVPRSGRGPFGDRPDVEPQRRSSEREPSRVPRTHPSPDPRPVRPSRSRPDSEPQRRSSEREPSPAPRTHPSPVPPRRPQPSRRPTPLGAVEAQHRRHAKPQQRSTDATRSPSSAAPDPLEAARTYPTPASSPPTRRSREASTRRRPPRGFATGPADQYVGWLGSIWLTQATTPPPTCTASL